MERDMRDLLLLATAAVCLAAILPVPVGAAEQTAVAYIQARYADDPEPGDKARYSPRIEKLWAQCNEREKKTGDPCMDFDIWTNAQDWEIKKLKIEQTGSGADSASVKASFDNYDRHETIGYDLLKDKKGWMVDEIKTDCDTLSGVLKGEQSKC
jgi:hypothetical protein